jgi:hypothetical protein
MIESIVVSDKTLDTSQGPIPDVMIRPQAGQLAKASAEAESLRTLFTLQFSTSATDEEVQNALANYGSTPGVGTKSRHIQYFMRFTRPSEDINIPTGTLVSNSDGSLVYSVVNSGTIVVTSADAFYNASRSAYEIGLLVEAVGTGKSYELPKGRVNTILTTIAGIDSTENRAKSSGGLDKESKDNQATRLKKSLRGINKGAPSGIMTSILDAFSESVYDVAVIQPFEKEFQRMIEGPALDVYLIGSILEPYTETTIAITGQTIVPLSKVPVVNVTSVIINGISVTDYTLVADTSFETGLSLDSFDVVVLGIPLITGDIVTISYEYNRLLSDVNTTVFNDGEEYLFNTDIKTRSAFPVNPIIKGTVQAFASFTTTEVEENVNTFLTTEFNFTSYTEIVFPEVIRQRMINEVSGVQNFNITEFRRSKGSLSSIEPLVFARNEISEYDPSIVFIKVTK